MSSLILKVCLCTSIHPSINHIIHPSLSLIATNHHDHHTFGLSDAQPTSKEMKVYELVQKVTMYRFFFSYGSIPHSHTYVCILNRH
jgi:hypothetical protein